MSGKGNRILVIEDDLQFRQMLEQILVRNSYEPVLVEDANIAQERLKSGSFDLVLSDIKLPQMSGVDLLNWIKENASVPVVLMTGFSDLLESKKAIELGADGFLAKPFKSEELTTVLSSILGKDETENQSEDVTENDSEYSKILIDDFISGREMNFDIFIYIKGKYIKIAHQGENIGLERIKSYKEKNVNFLHVKRSDFKTYLGFNLSVGKALSASKDIGHKRKINSLRHSMEIVIQNLMTSEIDGTDFAFAARCADNSVSILLSESESLDMISTLSTHSDYLYTHSVGVSVYSTLIARAMGWQSHRTLFILSIAGLLHDIGCKELPKALWEKPRSQLTQEEVKILETHPTRGMEILSHVRGIPSDILRIVKEHHENSHGTGYPVRMNRYKIHPLSRIVAIANDFCNLIIKAPDTPGLAPKEALKQLISLKPDYYHPDVLQGLSTVLSPKVTDKNNSKK